MTSTGSRVIDGLVGRTLGIVASVEPRPHALFEPQSAAPWAEMAGWELTSWLESSDPAAKALQTPPATSGFVGDSSDGHPVPAAVSAASEPWIAFASIDSAKSLRIVPAAAFAGSVAPISSRRAGTAPSFSSTIVTQGPDVMKSTRLPKNGRALWTA